ncbi:MAG: hypothetical protein NPIRA02_35290 [Nitrospirales bacterium]|nr:MAG: hypothetical protein NPIRA02_35290 [Nitrospirales bacterium]
MKQSHVNLKKVSQHQARTLAGSLSVYAKEMHSNKNIRENIKRKVAVAAAKEATSH